MEKQDFENINIQTELFSIDDMKKVFKAGYYRARYEEGSLDEFEPSFKEYMENVYTNYSKQH